MDIEWVSEGLCGRGMRLPLLVWIRERADPLFYITEASKATGYTHAHVAKELRTFAELGLLAPLPAERRNDRQYYRVDDACPLWRVIDAAAELVREGHVSAATAVT